MVLQNAIVRSLSAVLQRDLFVMEGNCRCLLELVQAMGRKECENERARKGFNNTRMVARY